MMNDDPELKKMIEQGRRYIEQRQRWQMEGAPVTPSAVMVLLGVSLEEATEIMQFADHDLGQIERDLLEDSAAEFRNIDGSKVNNNFL